MIVAQEKTPAPEGAGAGGKRQFKNTSHNYITADDALAILRDAQSVMREIAQALDRLDRTARALIGGAP